MSEIIVSQNHLSNVSYFWPTRKFVDYRNYWRVLQRLKAERAGEEGALHPVFSCKVHEYAQISKEYGTVWRKP